MSRAGGQTRDPDGSEGKESACNSGGLGSIPCFGGSPGGGNGNSLQYSCLENSHGQRSLVGCSVWGLKDLDMTEQLNSNINVIITDIISIMLPSFVTLLFLDFFPIFVSEISHFGYI